MLRTDSMASNDTESTSLPPADVTHDFRTSEFTENVPLTRDTDGPCTTESGSGDWSAEVKQENLGLPAVKQEPDDTHVCCRVLLFLCSSSFIVLAVNYRTNGVVFNYYVHYSHGEWCVMQWIG